MTVKVVRPAPERTAFTHTQQHSQAPNHLGYAGDEDEQSSAETGAPVQYVEGEAPLLGDEEFETPWDADAEAREVEKAPAPKVKKTPRAKTAPKAKAAPAVEVAPKRGPGRPRLSLEEKARRAEERKAAKAALKTDPVIAAAAVAKPKPKRVVNNDGTPNKRGRKSKAEAPESWKFLDARPPRTAINIRLESSIIEWFKRAGAGYQTRINEALKTFIEACQNEAPATA